MLKIVAVLALITVCTIPVTKSQLTCKGCPVTLTGDGLKEAEEVLIDSLGKLASGSGPTYK